MEQPKVNVQACTSHSHGMENTHHSIHFRDGDHVAPRLCGTSSRAFTTRACPEGRRRAGAARVFFVKRPMSQGHSGAHDLSCQKNVVPGLAGGRQLSVLCQFGGSTRKVSARCSPCARQHPVDDSSIKTTCIHRVCLYTSRSGHVTASLLQFKWLSYTYADLGTRTLSRGAGAATPYYRRMLKDKLVVYLNYHIRLSAVRRVAVSSSLNMHRQISPFAPRQSPGPHKSVHTVCEHLTYS